MNNATKVMHIDYDSEGNAKVIKEELINPNAHVDLNFEFLEQLTTVTLPGGKDKVRIPLKEAVLTNPDAANILRTDLRQVAFTAFGANQVTYPMFTNEVQSNKPQEEYLRDAAIGVIPVNNKGERPLFRSGFEGGTIIKNDKRDGRIQIPMEWVRYDQINKIMQLAQEIGLSWRLTDDATAYGYITTAANYTRSNTSNDNDIGANTQTLTWNADSLRTARAIISTSKDKKSGAYLGYNADCLIAGPLMEVPVLQLLMSPMLQRQHGNTTAEAIGTGTMNPMRGSIRKVMFSPWFGASYGWAICDSTRGSFVRQNVEGWQLYQESQNATSESFMKMDAIEYMFMSIFGYGFIDDRAWFYSDSTTDATVS